MHKNDLDDFTRGYLECALWSSNDESRDDGGDPLDRNYSIADIAPESLAKAKADCDAFFAKAKAAYLAVVGQQRMPGTIGHDFWLTRNGHGAGFWDGDYPEPHATTLTDAAHSFGECSPYVGDDGRVYL